MNSFQLKIFEAICCDNKNKNIMISPLSIYHILSLTTNGTLENTKTEMLSALNNENEDKMNEINKLIYSIIKNFKTVEIENAIFSKMTPLDTFNEKLNFIKPI